MKSLMADPFTVESQPETGTKLARDIIPPFDEGESYLGFGSRIALSIEDANLRFRERQVNLLRGFGLRFRYREKGVLPPWFEVLDDGAWTKDARAALRYIAAGFAVFADELEGPPRFDGEDWALFSGLAADAPMQAHQAAFVALAAAYIEQQVQPVEEIGSSGIDRKYGGDFDFVLCDIIALIHTFVGRPDLLTNDMVRHLICQSRVTFPEVDGSIVPDGEVPFSGQGVDRWLFQDNDEGLTHYFVDRRASPLLSVAVSTPETENHLLLITSWRYFMREYLEWVRTLPAGHPRRDPRLRALARYDQPRYTNEPAMRDLALQLLGRIPHAGPFEANAKPYHSITTRGALAFFQASAALFPDDPERHKVHVAARNALDYLAAEFAFQSFEGKRIAPSRRQGKNRFQLNPYGSDYLANVFGVLTGAYVYSDENGAGDVPGGPDDEPAQYNEPAWALNYHWRNLDENGGYALWALLSGYLVPRPVHQFMLTKHAGYLARIQTRHTSDAYPLRYTYNLGSGSPDAPPPARPRYFGPVSSGEVAPQDYDIGESGEFMPVTQVYFTTSSYLSSAGGFSSGYYQSVLDGIPNILEDLAPDSVIDRLHEYDTFSRPTLLLPRGNLQVRDGQLSSIEALSASVPLMFGQGEYAASENLSTYKSLSVGYCFTGHDDDRHLEFPHRYPESWNEAAVSEVGTGRALFRVFDFTGQPDHPLAGHYWIIGRFSKSENDGLYRSYARGLWEIVPGHLFPNAAALAQHLADTNPATHFNDGTGANDNYLYTMASSGETVLIDKLLGSSRTDQTILRIWAPDGTEIPLNRYIADMRDKEELRLLPLMDVWQVDRDYRFTGEKYAHADGRGRVTVHHPFLGETLHIDSSDYRSPSNQVQPAGVQQVLLPGIPGTDGQSSQVLGMVVDDRYVYATHSFVPEPNPMPTAPGEVVAVERDTLQVAKRVTVGRSPHTLAHNPDTGRLYAVNYHDMSISVIDTESFAVVKTLAFDGFAIIGVAVSRRFNRVFANQPGQNRVLVVDGGTDAPMTPMPVVGATGHLAMDDTTNRLFLTVKHPQNPAWQEIVEYQVTETGQQELRRITVDWLPSVPAGIAVDTDRIYVLTKNGTGPGGYQVTVVNRDSFTLAGPLPLPNLGLAVAVSTSQKVVYVATSADVLAFDAVHLQPLRRIPVRTGQVKAALGVDDRSGALYFSGTRNNTISVPIAVSLGT